MQKREILHKIADFMQKKRNFLQIEMLCKSQPRCKIFDKVLSFCQFCHVMSCFKKCSKEISKNKSKFVLYCRFTPCTRPF